MGAITAQDALRARNLVIARAAEPFGSRVANQLESVVRDVPLDGGRLEDVLGAQVRIRIEGAKRVLVPETAAATDLLGGGQDGAVATAIRGYAELVDPAGGQLRGIALSTSDDGYRANEFASFGEFTGSRLPGGQRLSDADFTAARGALGEIAADLASQFTPEGVPVARIAQTNWLHVGPTHSRLLEAHLRNLDHLVGGARPGPRESDELAHLLTHERLHLEQAGDGPQWLEEGSTEMRARTSREVQRTADALGLTTSLPEGARTVVAHLGLVAHPYTEWADAIAAVVRRGGIEPDGIEAAALIRGDLGTLTQRLADPIVRRHGLDPSEGPRISRLIASINGDPYLEQVLVGNTVDGLVAAAQ